jgi:hypothetical protein
LAAARAAAVADGVPAQTRAARKRNPPLQPLPPVKLKQTMAVVRAMRRSKISTLAWTELQRTTVVLVVRAARATASNGTKRERNYSVSVDSRTMQRDS